MYFCNKCGYVGHVGPNHLVPRTPHACEYHAAYKEEPFPARRGEAMEMVVPMPMLIKAQWEQGELVAVMPGWQLPATGLLVKGANMMDALDKLSNRMVDYWGYTSKCGPAYTTPPNCADCHYHESWGGAGDPYQCMCTNPHLIPLISPSTNKAVRCNETREFAFACGIEGRWFTPTKGDGGKTEDA